MNSSNLNAISVGFEYPWLLFLLIPAVGLMLWPYFRLPKQVRRTRNRVISLVLHSIVLTALVFMVSGISVLFTEVTVKNDVILLVDLSDSNRASEEDMNEFIRTVLDSQEEGYRVGIITFANGTVYSSQLRTDGDAVYRDYSDNTNAPVGNATNIADAVLYARNALTNPKNGRIIILSDGVQTDGNALSAVKAVANMGTRVDTVFFSFEGRNREVLVSGIEVPEKASLGDTLQITVSVMSLSAGPAVLTLYDNGELFDEKQVDLSGGLDNFIFEYPLLTPNLHEFSVEIFSEGDTLEENNSYFSYVNIRVSTSVLIVDGTGEESAALKDILDEDYDVTVTTPAQLPATVSELSKYDEVIFVNVANSDLPKGFDGILTEYVEDYGGGFFTVGGDKAYDQEDMEGTKYENLLPIEANTSNRTLGLLLVIDCSSSMTEKVAGTNMSRIELAKQAALASLEELRPDDYIGVVGFNSNSTVIPMQSVERKDTISRQINNLTTATGTHYLQAIIAARSNIITFKQADIRHIIFLADGNANDLPGSLNTVNGHLTAMAQDGITISTIALGPDVSTQYLESFAKIGGGEFYNVSKESELVKIMVEETKRVSAQRVNEEQFTPVINSHTPAVAGISELPALGGYFGTRLKEGATGVLMHDNSPIYAEWARGNGRVGSFMCDLSGNWSSLFLDKDSVGRKLILNIVGALFPKVSNDIYDPIRVEFLQDNFTTRVSITTDAATDTLTARLISPDGTSRSLDVEKLSDRSFATTFHTNQRGTYTVVVDNGTEQFNAYTTFSYSSEYNVFIDETESFAFLESLSKAGNGTMLFSAENLFGEQNELTERNFDLQLPLIIICCVLFLLDIFVRKFKIKWPKEIAEDRRKKREGLE